jgi:HD superfamily phosphohydrolase
MTSFDHAAPVPDAVHGSIDIRDDDHFSRDASAHAIIARLLHSAPLERLRHIKQLGFTSRHYTGADHSRFAHSLGTLHTMRLILERISVGKAPPFDDLSPVQECFAQALEGHGTPIRRVVQHLLVAALLQDIGELPYGSATTHVYSPSPKLKRAVGDFVGTSSVDGWSSKDVFTVGCILEHLRDQLADLDLRFLVYLITGRAAGRAVPKLLAFRHIVNGQVDADRLDYVFRDAHFTIGPVGRLGTLLDSILGYDEVGPLFDSPAPVSHFLATRAHLYASVYWSPTRRFWDVLLLNLLKGIKKEDHCASFFAGSLTGWVLDVDDFLSLDDTSLAATIHQLAARKALCAGVDERTACALEVFTTRTPAYSARWLHKPEDQDQVGTRVDPEIPQNLFWDCLSDVGGRLYDADSIRIRSKEFTYVTDRTLPLRNCGGAFQFGKPWKRDLLPDPSSILIFAPQATSGPTWEPFERALRTNEAYDLLVRRDPLAPHDYPTDTRDRRRFPQHKGPTIFISYSHRDTAVVWKLIEALYARQSRYIALIGRVPGIRRSPDENVQEAIDSADAVIMVISDNYVRAYKEKEGFIWKEVRTLIKAKDRLTFAPVRADRYDTRLAEFPWKQLGIGMPWVGDDSPGLREAPPPDVATVIEGTLRDLRRLSARRGR